MGDHTTRLRAELARGGDPHELVLTEVMWLISVPADSERSLTDTLRPATLGAWAS